MYKACIFDLDGTLANTLTSIAHFGNGSLRSLGLPGLPENSYKLMVGNGADMLMRRMLGAAKGDFTEAEVRQLRQEYDRRYEANPLYLVTPYAGMPELLLRLTAAEFQLAVLSNKPDNVTGDIVRALFPVVNFFHVQGQLAGVPAKPDPSAVNAILDKMQLPKEQVLYVGDSGVDMETGNNAGLKTAGVLWGFREEKELTEKGAAYLVDSSKELERILFMA